jgi:hypothetical protein|tara:strand:- start:572 stop:733 length:162 start_codon:yes stop_codon:yes gene_type:complete
MRALARSQGKPSATPGRMQSALMSLDPTQLVFRFLAVVFVYWLGPGRRGPFNS